jgi:predicted permease
VRFFLHNAFNTLRRLTCNRSLSLSTIITLAVAIGATTAIFSVVNAVLIQPLPYPDSQQLVGVWHTAPGIDAPQFEQANGTYLLYRRDNHVFDEIGIYRGSTVNLTGGEIPEELTAAEITASAFNVLQVPARLGRVFVEADESPDAEPTVILSHRLWRRHFAADTGIIGQKIQLDQIATTVVGVMPAHFRFPSPETELWRPVTIDPADLEVGAFIYPSIARLRHGVDPAAAAADISALVHKIPGEYGKPDLTPGIIKRIRLAVLVRPLRDELVGDVAGLLWILLGSAGAILLIACANVANLGLVRAEADMREVAIRSALGASRGQLAAALLIESVMAATVAGVSGLALAAGGIQLLLALAPEGIPRLEEIGIDATVVVFTLAISILSGLLSGTVPSMRGLPEIGQALKEGSRHLTSGRARHRARSLLVTAQIALALILLIGSGLMVRSFRELRSQDLGFTAGSMLTLRLSLPETAYPSTAEIIAFYQELVASIRTLPGVTAVSGVNHLPLAGEPQLNTHVFEDFPPDPDEVPPIIPIRLAMPGYFETMEIPLLAGRTFEPADLERPTRSILVSQALAEQFWPGENAVGKRIHPQSVRAGQWFTIVGVVGSVRDQSLHEPPTSVVYYPLLNRPALDQGEVQSPRSLSLAIRTSVSATSLLVPIRSSIWALDPDLPIANVRTMEKIIAEASARTAFTMLLLVIAAVVALVLGTVGLYGVVSYVVSLRTREIGIRLALGAEQAEVSRMVVRQGLGLALGGLLLGLAGAFALTRLLESYLFMVNATDPLTFVSLSLLLLAVALLASYLPARRAAAVDPLDVLRYE